MARVERLLLQATIYLYRSGHDAAVAVSEGGSGVLVGTPSDRGTDLVDLFAVTCDHVATFGAPVVLVTDTTGQQVVLDDLAWRPHPEGDPDVAVARVASGVAQSPNNPYSYVPLDRFVMANDLDPRGPSDGRDPDHPYYLGELVGAGDNILVVGRFLADNGVLSQTPTVRFGNLASAGTVVVEFRSDRRPSQQSCFLVESHSLPGYSGSAVYLFHAANTYNGLDLHIGDHNHPLWKFLGIDCGHMMATLSPESGVSAGWAPAMAIPEEPRRGQVNAGMMTVVPAWKIAEAIANA